jgi:hypothetical protein
MIVLVNLTYVKLRPQMQVGDTLVLQCLWLPLLDSLVVAGQQLVETLSTCLSSKLWQDGVWALRGVKGLKPSVRDEVFLKEVLLRINAVLRSSAYFD